jgi:hypothetical protein
MNQIVDMDYLTAVENKARAELDTFTQNNMNTLNVIRLAKLGLIAEQSGLVMTAGQSTGSTDSNDKI